MGSGDTEEGISGLYGIGCGVGRTSGSSSWDADDLPNPEIVGIQSRIGRQDGVDCYIITCGNSEQCISGLNCIGYAARRACCGWDSRYTDGLPDLQPVRIESWINGQDSVDCGAIS